jgi:cytochrome c oxidase subunit III
MSARQAERKTGSPGDAIPGAGRLAMTLFLAALGVLFAASMVGYLVVRLRAPAWPPAGSPRLPGGLWISTAILLLSSATMHRALSGVRRREVSSPRAGEGSASPASASGRPDLWLWCTFGLGLAFLASQILNWIHLIFGSHLPAQSNLYAFTFYMLTGLHGAHVVGGLIPLAITSLRAGRGRYNREAHNGVLYMSMYWHFLDAVWLVMFVVLMVAA